jgi:hypothetical protein
MCAATANTSTAALGNKGWSYDEVLPISEEHNETYADQYHGRTTIERNRGRGQFDEPAFRSQHGRPVCLDRRLQRAGTGAFMYQVTQKNGALGGQSYLKTQHGPADLTSSPALTGVLA